MERKNIGTAYVTKKIGDGTLGGSPVCRQRLFMPFVILLFEDHPFGKYKIENQPNPNIHF